MLCYRDLILVLGYCYLEYNVSYVPIGTLGLDCRVDSGVGIEWCRLSIDSYYGTFYRGVTNAVRLYAVYLVSVYSNDCLGNYSKGLLFLVDRVTSVP